MRLRIIKGYHLSTSDRKIIINMRTKKLTHAQNSNGTKTYEIVRESENKEFIVKVGAKIEHTVGTPQMEYLLYTLLDG